MKTFLGFLAVIGMASSVRSSVVDATQHNYNDDDNDPISNAYAFDYRVYGATNAATAGYHATSTKSLEPQYFGQSEHRSAGKIQGQYHVQLPDGRVQRVRYYVDRTSGFVADVTYEQPDAVVVVSNNDVTSAAAAEKRRPHYMTKPKHKQSVPLHLAASNKKLGRVFNLFERK